MDGDKEVKNTCGCPQGSIISTIMANIYLHHVTDEWIESIKQSHFRGRAELIRYADDMVYTFERPDEAMRRNKERIKKSGRRNEQHFVSHI